jgi:hypothetical protein
MASDMRRALVRALLLTTEAEEVRSSEFTAWQRARPGHPWQILLGYAFAYYYRGGEGEPAWGGVGSEWETRRPAQALHVAPGFLKNTKR